MRSLALEKDQMEGLRPKFLAAGNQGVKPNPYASH
jgi:hypothetical protein